MNAQANVRRVLYITYDGLTDPLGRSQVLPYLIGLAATGYEITILSFEKRARALERPAIWDSCHAAGIAWHPLNYHKHPAVLSSVYDVRMMKRVAAKLHRQQPFDLVHCRSDLAGIAGMTLQHRYGVKFLYDMRALWPDERAEGGAWDQRKPVYRWLFAYFKRIQRQLVARADAIVTLSQNGRAMLPTLGLSETTEVEVIPCCADFDHFTLPDARDRTERRRELGVGDAPLLIHLGTVGCNVLLGEMLDFLAVYRRRHPRARLLFLTPSGEPDIAAAAAARALTDAIYLRAAPREAVPGWIGAADLGLFFVRPVRSKRAASPTKLGEMLACGLPVVTNNGIGDVSDILADVGGGVVIDRFDTAAYDAAIDRVASCPADPAAIRARARRWFDVANGIARYDLLYSRLTGDNSTQE